MKSIKFILLTLALMPASSMSSDRHWDEWDACYIRLAEQGSFIVHEKHILNSGSCIETIKSFIREEIKCTEGAIDLEFKNTRFKYNLDDFCMFEAKGGTYKYFFANQPGSYYYGMLAFERWD